MEADKVFLVGTIVFVLLVSVITGLTTWLIRLVFENNNCQLDPNIWCYNDWKCNSPASGPGINPCFGETDPSPNLTECLYGPTSSVANQCYTSAGACGCNSDLQQANNCFNSCPGTTADISTANCSTLK